jgi:putative DNA primase/helicase
MRLDFPTVTNLVGGRVGTFDIACPSCGPGCKSDQNRKRKVLRVWTKPDFASWKCVRCDESGYAAPVSRVQRSEAWPKAEPSIDDNSRRKAEIALDLWRSGRPFVDSLAERYLQQRGLAYNGAALRFHPTCRFGSDTHPALIALMRSAKTNEPQGVHRTALLPDGSGKAGPGKMMLGPSAGAVVKLTDDADVTLCLAISEGVESGLALRRLPDLAGMPVWATLSAGGMKAFPVLAGIEVLWIAADHDRTGILAARECACRWQQAGREVIIVVPRVQGIDLNDIGGGDV